MLLAAAWLASRCATLSRALGGDEEAEVPPAATAPAAEDMERTDAGADAAEVRRASDGGEAAPPPAAPPRKGALEGRIVLAEEGPVDTFDWEVRLLGPGRRWPLDAVPLQKDGSFRVDGLRPGTYRAVAEHSGMAVARVDALEVAAGGTLRDPRLLPWRVEESCREMRVHVVGEPGRRGDTNVWMMRPDGESRGHAVWEGSDRVLRCPQGEAPDVLVLASGYRPHRLRWQDGRVQVELEAGLEITLQAVAPVSLAKGLKRGSCVLRPEHPVDGISAPYFDVQFSVTPLLRGEPVRLRVPVATTYELRFAGTDVEGPGFLPMYGTVLQRGIRLEEDGAEARVVLPDPIRNQ